MGRHSLMELALPFIVFGGFMLVFFIQARREGKGVKAWLADRNTKTVYVPGWWKPNALWVTALLTFFIAYMTVDQGWRWQYLLVVPILGGFFALSTTMLSWLLKRRFPQR